jgi:GNAT superfamily N-acetyltransferase
MPAELTPDELLERTQWDFFWAPPDATIVDRPELAYIHCPRDVQYANCVVRTRAPAERLPALCDEVTAAHATVRSRWLVRPAGDRAVLELALAAGGWDPRWEHDGFVVDTGTFTPCPSRGVSVRTVRTRADLVDWMDVSGRAFDAVRAVGDAELEVELERCTRADARTSRFVATDDASGRPVASAGMNLYPRLRFGFLWAGGTVPEARGRGAYSALVAARVAHARTLGFRYVGLYARLGSSAPIVARQGFERHGRMTYWDKDPSA